MRRTNGSRTSGERRRRGGLGMNQDSMRQTERLKGRNEGYSPDGHEGYNRLEMNTDRNREGYSGRFADEDRWQHYNMNNENDNFEDGRGSDSYNQQGSRGYDRGWQDKGVYSTINENDIRSELDYRGHRGGTEGYGRGSDYMDEDHNWRMAGSERLSENSNERDGENWRSGETHRRGRRRRRVIYD